MDIIFNALYKIDIQDAEAKQVNLPEGNNVGISLKLAE